MLLDLIEAIGDALLEFDGMDNGLAKLLGTFSPTDLTDKVAASSLKYSRI
jgi:hypothetical protein